MKKLAVVIGGFVLSACSSPVQQSSVPMDMKTVQEYQARIATAQSNKVAAQTQNEPWELNQSDHRPKVVVVQTHPRVYPSFYYGWGRHHRHHSGVGVRLGGYY